MSYAGPVNYRDASGHLQPIDDTATGDSAGGWKNTAGLYQGSVPSTLAGKAVTVSSGSDSVSFTLLSAAIGGPSPSSVSPTSAPGSANKSTVSYARPLPDTNISYAFGNAGVDETLALASAQAPVTYSWSLSTSASLTATMAPGGYVSIKDASGTEVMHLTAPSIEDTAHLVGPAPTMSLSPDGTVLSASLAPDAAWLVDPGRSFPVTVDPSVTVNVPNSGSECQMYQSVPNTPECNPTTNYLIGYNGFTANAHSMFRFENLTSDVPYDALVQNAVFGVYENGASGTSAMNVSMGSILNEPWNTTTATWNDYNGGLGYAWMTGGGDATATPGTIAVPAGTANGWLTWNPVQQVQAWVNGSDVAGSGSQPANEGFLLTGDSQPNTAQVTNWQSSVTSQWPYLSVQYTPRIGTGAGMNSLKFSIDDKTTLGVNAANGDLNVDTSLFNIKGVGLPLQIDQNYDSQGATSTSMGTGSQGAAWALSSSFDQPQLILKANYPGVMELVSSSGTNAVFTNGNIFGQFTSSPPGLNATAAATSSTTLAINFKPTGEIWNFTLISGSLTNYHLTNMTDRNGNVVAYNYNTAGTQLTSITDTEGRTVSIGYNTNNLVSSITDSTGRQITYGYLNPSSGVYRLQTATYGGFTTTYGYDTNGNLNEITDPVGNITTVAYNSAQQVTSVTRVTNNSTLAGNTTTYSYSPGSFSSPNAGLTTVTDPNGHATTYAYDAWDRVTTVTDANGNHQRSDYNAQSSVDQLTDSMSSPGITTLGYDLNNNLNKVTSPATGSGQIAASQSLGYSPGQPNYPSTAIDAQGNCTSYTYDTAGNVQGSTPGQSSSCTGSGGGTSTNAYQGDGSTACGGKSGELCSTTDAKGNVTSYAYDSLGQLTSITPPSPQGTTTLTYDGLSRPHTIATPTGTATYTYDVWDRITQVSYGSGPTLSYTYDADGNLQKRVDPSGTNTFIYDTLNRITEQKLPGSADSCSGFAGIKLYYDAANNLTSYCNGRGTTVYGYDPGNRVTSLAEPGGTCTGTPAYCTTFAYNANNQRTTTTFPGGATLNVAYDPAGNEMSAIGKKASGTVLTSYTYSYAASTQDKQLRQNVIEADPISSLTTSYAYDTQNRLVSATNTSTSLYYAYDAAGNRCALATSCASPTYSYNAANQLTSGPAGSYGYDSSGEETSSPQLSNLSYNTGDQTTSITPSGGSAVSLSYGDVGQFNLTKDGTATLNYGPLGLDSVTNGSTTTYLILDPRGNAVGQRTSGTGSGYFLKDATGSIMAMISGTGITTYDRFTYDPYGNKTVVSGSTYEFLGYAGGYQEANTALVKFGTRYYDVSTGRWTQVDPIGGSIVNPSTLNGYIYSGDNPVNEVDPFGLAWCSFSPVGCGTVSNVTNSITQNWDTYLGYAQAAFECWAGGTIGAAAGGVVTSESGGWGVVPGAIAGCALAAGSSFIISPGPGV